ncbi:(5-formylfuran-3-yl)methyl phosphate synthase [Planctellipticum variicoloris]|uniref:(5-formylfuran-3-yl)methyl phosphate synthase n=1 Tax=Planctellipticum variicoloris TaxID=3064265 RepID=UPI003013D97A|nr:(5-formylfuran-3-yl)methyl phosphate synthase [Planctomycetaceae bacterium SH412]
MTPSPSSMVAPSRPPRFLTQPPRLLVSVCDADEARAALAGGADIIDVKDPAQGSLGRATPEAWAAIAAAIPAGIPLSLALGELREWSPTTPIPNIPAQVRWLKLGLAGMRDLTDWRTTWSSLRTRFEAACPTPIGWVAVAYADADIAEAPPVEDIARAAMETGCAGFLIDTWSKGGSGLVELGVDRRLRSILPELGQQGLFTALAGSLRPVDVAAVAGWGADIIAVRTAACEGGVRTGRVSQEAVRSLQQRLSLSVVARPR